MIVTPPITIGSAEVTVLIGDSVCSTEVCDFSMLCADELPETVTCSVFVCDAVLDDIVAEGGLLLIEDEVVVLRPCKDNDSAAGVAIDVGSLEIVVVLVARIFACDATALAAAGYVNVDGVQAVCGHPVYRIPRDVGVQSKDISSGSSCTHGSDKSTPTKVNSHPEGSCVSMVPAC